MYQRAHKHSHAGVAGVGTTTTTSGSSSSPISNSIGNGTGKHKKGTSITISSSSRTKKTNKTSFYSPTCLLLLTMIIVVAVCISVMFIPNDSDLSAQVLGSDGISTSTSIASASAGTGIASSSSTGSTGIASASSRSTNNNAKQKISEAKEPLKKESLQVTTSAPAAPAPAAAIKKKAPLAGPKKKIAVSTKKKPYVRKWAYAFLLGGIPTIYNTTERSRAGYRGLLYNVLVSIQTLRDSGSRADMIVMVHMNEAFGELPLSDYELLRNKMNVTMYYVPPTPSLGSLDAVNAFSTIALEKFRILDFTKYTRVMYLEADITPHCNLDYLFELSDPIDPETSWTRETQEEAEETTRSIVTADDSSKKTPLRLEENVILSISATPASGSFFILRPGKDLYKQFLKIFSDYPVKFAKYNQTMGWGHQMEGDDEFWFSLKTMGRKNKKHDVHKLLKWNFEGAESDSGLLFHFTRFIRKRVSMIVKDRVYTIQNGILLEPLTENPLYNHSCLSEQDEHTGGIGAQYYASSHKRSLASPFGVPPYRDFAQWEHSDNAPWNYARAPHPSLPINSARRRWFAVLRKLDQRHQMNLGLYDRETTPVAGIANTMNVPPVPVDPEQEKLLGEKTDLPGVEPNWKFIPRYKQTNLLPVWSTKVHALKIWAKQQSDDYNVREKNYKPPLLVQLSQQGPHRQELLTDVPPVQESLSNAPLSCNCSTPLELDPCSIPNQPKVEEWMKPRLGLGFSKQRPACPNAARHHMHVLLPFANLDLETIKASYCSVQCQNYARDDLTIYLYQDGSNSGDDTPESSKEALDALCGTDGVFDFSVPVLSSEMATYEKTEEEFNDMAKQWAVETMKTYAETVETKKDQEFVGNTLCLRSNEHSGPGGAKYWAFRLVEARAEANDVVVVVDGDDEFNTPRALQVINQKYLEQSAWVTYGSYTGKYSEQTKVISRSIQIGKAEFQPRKDSPTWRFGHTRTFKTHLLNHVGRRDFTFKDNTWLLKATDRGFVYRILELSGVDRVAFIPQALYKYKWSPAASTIAQVPKEVRVAHLEHVQSLDPSERLNLPFHIIIVCWNRVYLLKDQLRWLQEQHLAQNRQIVVHLLSNSPETHPAVVEAVGAFSKIEFSDCVPLDVKIIQKDQNWHAFSRFLHVRELRRTEPMDVVFFVDDDQYWLPDFLTGLLSYHRPQGMTTWYGKTFSKKSPSTGTADFWTSDILWSDIATQALPNVTTFAYGGPGGSVFDTNLWLFDQQLLRLRGDLREYYEFDDVWTSYCIDALLGWEHRRIPWPLPIDIATFNKEAIQQHIVPKLPTAVAEEMTRMNKEIAKKLQAVATFSGASRDKKTNMFITIQRDFHWDVARNGDSPRPNTNEEVTATSEIGLTPMQSISTIPMTPLKDTKRAFVCITGQFERLALRSKIRRFFRPILKSGWDIDVALVLSGGESAFTNKGFGNLKPEAMDTFFEKIEDAVAALQAANVTVVSPHSEEDGGLYDRLENPKVHQQYLIHLYEAQHFMRTFDQQMDRAENHPRIYESYQRCLFYAEKQIESATTAALAQNNDLPEDQKPTLETFYDVYFRMRDDIGFKDVLPKPVLASLLEPPLGSVLVTGCRGWGGMNDRFAAVSPNVARTYFQRPYEIFTSGENLKDHIVNNPESFLLYSFVTAGIQVFAHRRFKGVMRFFKEPKTKQAQIYGEDLAREWCFKEPLNHTDHLLGLYGWNIP